MMSDDKELFDLKSIDNSLVKQLAQNILPNCNTVLHYIYNKQSIVKDMYDMSNIEGEQFNIPFICNLNGKSPIDKCITNKEYKVADLFLQKLSDQSIDHHGKAIANGLSLAISLNLPSVGSYLDARFK